MSLHVRDRIREILGAVVYFIALCSDSLYMPRSILYVLAALSLLTLPVGGLAAQNSPETGDDIQDMPSWVLNDLGMQALQQQELTQAIEYFQEVLSREGTFPEAQYGLGLAYLGGGDIQLALRELQESLDDSQYLYNQQDRYLIQYALADAHYYSGEQRKLQDTLLDIVDEDPHFSGEEARDLRRNYRRTLQEQGIDQLFQLYRLPEIFSRRAHRELGMQFLLQNLPSQAVDHLILAALMGFSEVIEEMMRIFPLFRYESVADTYDRIFSEDPRTEHLREYLLNDSFTRELLYLADAFYIEGHNRLANEIWRLVAEIPGPELFQERAAAQLRQPRLPEPFIRRMYESGIK